MSDSIITIKVNSYYCVMLKMIDSMEIIETLGKVVYLRVNMRLVETNV